MRPTTVGSPPKRVRQNVSLSTTASGAPGTLSAAANVRPTSGRTPKTSKNPDVTHWRDTLSGAPSAPAITMAPTFGAKPAMPSKVRVRSRQSMRFGGDTRLRDPLSVRSASITRRSGWCAGSGRSSVASTSAKMALLAPMPSASVAAARAVNAGGAPHLPQRASHVVAQFLEASGQGHAGILHAGARGFGDVGPADAGGDRQQGLAPVPAPGGSRPELRRDVAGELLFDVADDGGAGGAGEGPVQEPAGEAWRRSLQRTSRATRVATERAPERDEGRLGPGDCLRAGRQHAIEPLGATAALRGRLAEPGAHVAARLEPRQRRVDRPGGNLAARCARRARAGSVMP